MVGKILVLILCCATIANAAADTFYVDSRSGNDTNPGTKDQPLKTLAQVAKKVNVKTERGSTTIKLEPGIYALSEAIVFQNKQSYSEEQRLSIEAAVLPDDPTWNPDLMPIILSIQDSGTPGQPGKPTQTYGLQIKMSHVTIRGLKFLGSPLPNNWYSPLECLENNLKDILVTQCLFIGNTDTLNIYSAVITDGHQFVVDHCIFYGCHACAVFWDGGRGIVGKQNAMRYCIVDGAGLPECGRVIPTKISSFTTTLSREAIMSGCVNGAGPGRIGYRIASLWKTNIFQDMGLKAAQPGKQGRKFRILKIALSRKAR